MKIKKLLSITLALGLVVMTTASCGTKTGTTNSSTADDNTTAIAASAANIVSIANTVTFNSDDSYFDWQSQIYQTLDLSQAAPAISKSGIYKITGTLKDGSLVVDVDKNTDSGTVYLVLANADLTSTASAPIYIKDAEKVVLILENGTTNTVHQGNNVTVNADNEPSAAIFSKANLTITGGGTLNVTSDFNDGITSKDTLKITDGTLNITAVGDGIVGKDVLALKSGTITATAGKKGIRSTNDKDSALGNILILGGTLDITSGSDAVKASGTLEIDGGALNVVSGGGYAQNTTVHTENNGPMGAGMGGMGRGTGQTPTTAPSTTTTPTPAATESETGTDSENINGLGADRNIIITQGEITVSAYDDALNANGGILIQGGTLNLESGDDGIHTDTNLIIDNGTINIGHAYEGIEGVNVTVNNGKITLTSSDDGFNINDKSGLLTINDGEISVNAEGDGLDSNGSAKMTGGTVYVNGPTSRGNGALDYDGSFPISGGTLFATDDGGMALNTSSDSSQLSLLMSFSTTQAPGTTITLKDSSGNTVAAYTPTKRYASIVISSPDLKTGQSYTLYNGNTQVVTFTPTDIATCLNESGITQNQGMGMGNGGGMRGGNPSGGAPAGGGPEGSMPAGGGPGGNGGMRGR